MYVYMNYNLCISVSKYRSAKTHRMHIFMGHFPQKRPIKLVALLQKETCTKDISCIFATLYPHHVLHIYRYMYLCIYEYIYIYICIHIFMYTHVHIYVHTHTYICIYVHIDIDINIHIYKGIRIYT